MRGSTGVAAPHVISNILAEQGDAKCGCYLLSKPVDRSSIGLQSRKSNRTTAPLKSRAGPEPRADAEPGENKNSAESQESRSKIRLNGFQRRPERLSRWGN